MIFIKLGLKKKPVWATCTKKLSKKLSSLDYYYITPPTVDVLKTSAVSPIDEKVILFKSKCHKIFRKLHKTYSEKLNISLRKLKVEANTLGLLAEKSVEKACFMPVFASDVMQNKFRLNVNAIPILSVKNRQLGVMTSGPLSF